MSALAVDHEPGFGWDDLVRIWTETDAPKGCKVEIIEGIVTVSPPPSCDHSLAASRVNRRLLAVIPEDWHVFQMQEAAVPSRSGLFIPDLMVVAEEDRPAPGDLFPASRAKLVVEITSSGNANHDRIAKAHGYAQAGVPLYLLLDPWHSGRPTATLYGDPQGGTYRVLESVEYGDKLTLPAPFDLTLDTATFPVS
ncbi:Uma2 family endonuclease [Streptomyces sp. NRRL F-5135]|uniref:Uma2 family endonuclease n=1 Tax=Streptomyces sp. NRRL F-5135 TaxID=1463858 RepID=UPI0004CA715D|nr:Uma2 family endonuclease [Streptomyces sp. NRRL F-5135]